MKNIAPAGLRANNPPPASTTPPKSRSNIVFGLVVLVIILAVAGAGFYFLQQLRESQEGLGGELDKDDQQILELTRQINNFQSQVAALHNQVATLESQLASKDTKLERELGQQAERFGEKLDAAKTELGTAITRIQRQLGKTRGDWLIADAEYLLGIANQRLHLIGDLKTTLVALEAADQRLRESGDPAMFKVRETLARDIDRLRLVNPVDVVGLFSRLRILEGKVEALPVFLPHAGKVSKPETVAVEQEKIQGEPGFDSLESFLSSTLDDLKGLVTVRRTDQVAGVILTPDEVLILQQGLLLKLEQARTALVQRNANIYMQSIDDAKDWLGKHFTTDDPLTQAFAAELDALRSASLELDLPDISGSLKLLRDITKLRLETDKSLNDGPAEGAGAER